MANKVHFKKVTIIGVGLIGASLGLALKKEGLAESITGVGRGLENLEEARRIGAVDAISQDIAEGVKDAELVIVAVPVMRIPASIIEAAAELSPGAIITDVGSVKGSIIEMVGGLPEGVHFVPAHPIAGTERSGAAAGFAELFTGRLCILTPTPETDTAALGAVSAMWQAVGSRVISMDVAAHDSVLSAVSHLPHMIAYTLVNTVAESARTRTGMDDILGFSAGGFRDFTRIASSSPEMWADICSANSEPIVEMIDAFLKRLERLKRLITDNDRAGIELEFKSAKRLRDSLIDVSKD